MGGEILHDQVSMALYIKMATAGVTDFDCLSIKELEQHAYHRMDKQTRDYYNEGADSGSTLQENSTAYDKYRIRPRVLRDVSNVDTSVNIFGFKNSIPLGVAPTASKYCCPLHLVHGHCLHADSACGKQMYL